MLLQVELRDVAAIKVAEYLETTGLTPDAAQVWLAISRTNPYDRKARERFADLAFDLTGGQYPRGSVGRSRFLLSLMYAFPTPKLTAAYFENLAQLLGGLPRRTTPGEVVLGLGSGRCGSTTLAASMAAVHGACATHENPPCIYWQPLEEQIRFHLDRFRLLADYYALVFDAAHWWLNILDRFFAEFPDGKAIGLNRNVDACVQSFLNVKGRGRQSVNHWAANSTPMWAANPWDPVYPSYPVPEGIHPDSEAAYAIKGAMIHRYVSEYNQSLMKLAEVWPEKIHPVRTEELGDDHTARCLSQFVGQSIAISGVPLNVGTMLDGSQPTFWV